MNEVESLSKRFAVFEQQFDRGVAVQSAGSIEKMLERLCE